MSSPDTNSRFVVIAFVTTLILGPLAFVASAVRVGLASEATSTFAYVIGGGGAWVLAAILFAVGARGQSARLVPFLSVVALLTVPLFAGELILVMNERLAADGGVPAAADVDASTRLGSWPRQIVIRFEDGSRSTCYGAAPFRAGKASVRRRPGGLGFEWISIDAWDPSDSR